MSTILIVGCGYVGTHLARIVLQQEKVETNPTRLIAWVRSSVRQAALNQENITTILGDLETPIDLSHLSLQEPIVHYLVPPPSRGVIDPRLNSFLNALERVTLPRKIVLISTSGVYGDCGGMWVDEQFPVNPRTERAKRRVHAEQTLQIWCARKQVPWVILRVPAIYGIERLPIHRLKQGLPVLQPHLSPFSNRIHVEDLATICWMAGNNDKVQGIYNVSDGNPTTMTDYFNQIADAVGLPRPPTIDWSTAKTQLSEDILSFLAESRRLDASKLQRDLGIVLKYPNLATALHGLSHVAKEKQ